MESPQPPQLTYVPSSAEKSFYELLFNEASNNKGGSISGAEAVTFLSRSKLPVALLKNIWVMADNPRNNSLDFKKFSVAVRLIQLYQNGQKAQGIDLKHQEGVSLQPPFFDGIPVPNSNVNPIQSSLSTGQQPNKPSLSTRQQPMQSSIQGNQSVNSSSLSHLQRASSSRVSLPPLQKLDSSASLISTPTTLTTQDLYTMSPQDESRYEVLFPNYSTNGDGYVYGPEAVALFSRSGLPTEHLREIWNLSDDPVDNRLSKIEFSIAMHLIVCISKKNLPLPTSLPPSLQELKRKEVSANNATVMTSSYRQPHSYMPSAVSSIPPPPSYGIPSPELAEKKNTSQPVPSEASTFPDVGKIYITDAFTGMNVENLKDQPITVSSQPLSMSTQQPMTQGSQSNTIPTNRKSLTTSPVNGEQEELKKVLQQLRAENISLKAQIGTYSNEDKEIGLEIAKTVHEIGSLSKELTSIRAQVAQANSFLVEATAELKAQLSKKSNLQDLISQETTTRNALQTATNTIQGITKDFLHQEQQQQQQTSFQPMVDFFSYDNISAMPSQPPPPPFENPPAEPPFPTSAPPPPPPSVSYAATEPLASSDPPATSMESMFIPMGTPRTEESEQVGKHVSESFTNPDSNAALVSSLVAMKAEAVNAKKIADKAKDEHLRVKSRADQLKQQAEQANKLLQEQQATKKKSMFRKSSSRELEKLAQKTDELTKKSNEAEIHVEHAKKNAAQAQIQSESFCMQVETAEMELAKAESYQSSKNNGGKYYASANGKENVFKL